jgi:EmrB/QacA subfamily drug resistance transporter
MKKSPWFILFVLALGTLLVGLDKTVVNLAVPAMMKDFHASISSIGWVSTIYYLTSAIFIPVFGKLSDKYGPRKIYLWGFVGFIAASIATGFSWSLASIVCLRAIQGIFAASVYPTAMAMIAETFSDKTKRAEALGIWTSIIAGSVVIGPLLGGPLIDHFSWPAAFFVNAPLGLISIALAFWILPKVAHAATPRSFDWKGASVFSIMLVGILLALERGPQWGWGSVLVIVLFIVGILGFLTFIALEKRTTHPFIPFSMLRNKILRSVLLISLINYGTLFGFMFLFSLYAQEDLHLSATKNGLFLLPLLIMVTLLAPIGGRMMKRFKAYIPVMIGVIISVLGMGILALFYYVHSPVILIVAMGLVGAGCGLTSAPLSTTTTTAVPPESVGFASSLLNLTRNIAGVIFIAIITILLATTGSYRLLFFLCAIMSLVTFLPSFALKKSTA